MYQPFQPGADAPKAFAGNFHAFMPPNQGGHGDPPAAPDRDKVRLVLYGTPAAVRLENKALHRVRYAEPNEWSRPMPTRRPGEVMCILTRRSQTE